ncbi:DUF488 family protein, N3 subclade [Rhodovibrio salinarum]|uniref:DUF488 family protein, N3 subclade n=1 Tax=Rhodovibrio salinarum TaxID=1087 RepID=UPI0004B318F7|nr:NAD(P)/FAD-dependent oxidoreductase [Rhodovibrio salinarum]
MRNSLPTPLEEFVSSVRIQNGIRHITPAKCAHVSHRFSILVRRAVGPLGNLSAARIADLDKRALARLAETLNRHRFVPGGTEGYRTAEVTLGGVDTRGLDLLAALSHTGNFSVGCYCAREDRCHRSVLRALLAERGAKIE